MRRLSSLAGAALFALLLAGCSAGTVTEDSVKKQEADTAARIKAKRGEVPSGGQGQ